MGPCFDAAQEREVAEERIAASGSRKAVNLDLSDLTCFYRVLHSCIVLHSPASPAE